MERRGQERQRALFSFRYKKLELISLRGSLSRMNAFQSLLVLLAATSAVVAQNIDLGTLAIAGLALKKGLYIGSVLAGKHKQYKLKNVAACMFFF